MALSSEDNHDLFSTN